MHKTHQQALIDAAYNLIRQVKMSHDEMTMALWQLLDRPSYEEKWLVIISAFQDDKDLKQIRWQTSYNTRVYERFEAIIYLENKCEHLSSKSRMLLRKYRDLFEQDSDLAKEFMRRYMYASSELQKYEDILSLIQRD